MITDENLPDGWIASSARTEYDRTVDREYETIQFDHESGEATVYVHEVQEPKEFAGWGYQVVGEVHSGESVREVERGPFEDQNAAREAALEFMTEYET